MPIEQWEERFERRQHRHTDPQRPLRGLVDARGCGHPWVGRRALRRNHPKGVLPTFSAAGRMDARRPARSSRSDPACGTSCRATQVVLVLVPSCGTRRQCSGGAPALYERGRGVNGAGTLLRGGRRLRRDDDPGNRVPRLCCSCTLACLRATSTAAPQGGAATRGRAPRTTAWTRRHGVGQGSRPVGPVRQPGVDGMSNHPSARPRRANAPVVWSSTRGFRPPRPNSA